MSNAHTYPPVVIVDEQDNEIGTAPLAEAWEKGLYHRIVSVFVEDDHGRMLLQLRGKNVKIYPNCWDQAAAGHVDEGFSYEESAIRELTEETGLGDVPLKLLGTFRSNETLDDGRIINQFERSYLARVPYGTVLRPDAQEVTKLQWFTHAELKNEITSNPESFTRGLVQTLRMYFPDF